MQKIKWLPTGIGTYIGKNGFVHTFVPESDQDKNEFRNQSQKQANKL